VNEEALAHWGLMRQKKKYIQETFRLLFERRIHYCLPLEPDKSSENFKPYFRNTHF
jgi:hypothetical protein